MDLSMDYMPGVIDENMERRPIGFGHFGGFGRPGFGFGGFGRPGFGFGGFGRPGFGFGGFGRPGFGFGGFPLGFLGGLATGAILAPGPGFGYGYPYHYPYYPYGWY